MLLTEQHLLKKYLHKKKKRYWQAAKRSHERITDTVSRTQLILRSSLRIGCIYSVKARLETS